jgi:hypothetical protein
MIVSIRPRVERIPIYLIYALFLPFKAEINSKYDVNHELKDIAFKLSSSANFT